MKRTAIPRTDLEVSQISFGAGTAAGLMLTGDRREQESTIARAVECGINHFDTAPAYGFGASEVNLGYALKPYKQDIILTSKVNLTPEQLQAGDIKKQIKWSVEQSLQRLQRDHLDILLLHNATGLVRKHQLLPPEINLAELFPSLSLNDILGPGGVMEAFYELKESGHIRYFGISGQDNHPSALKAVIAAGGIHIFNQPFNLLNPSGGFSEARRGREVPGAFRRLPDFIDFENMIEYAYNNQVGVSVIAPLAAGVLANPAVQGIPAPAVSQREVRFPLEGQFAQALALARRFAKIADESGMSLTQLAYRFVLSAPGVTTAVGGFSTIEQMEEAAGCSNKGPLDESILSALFDAWYEDSI